MSSHALSISEALPIHSAQRRSAAKILGQAHVVPKAFDQVQMWSDDYAKEFGDSPLAAKIWTFAGISTRRAVVHPVAEDVASWSTGQRMKRYRQEALPLGIRTVEQALANAGVRPDEVGLLAVVSCTGYGRVKPAERLGKNAAAPLVTGSPGGGRLVRSPVVTGNGSGPVRLDVLRGTAFALVGVDVDPASMLSEASQDLWSRAGARCITVGAGELPGVRPGCVVIVRPEQFPLPGRPGDSHDEQCSTVVYGLTALGSELKYS